MARRRSYREALPNGERPFVEHLRDRFRPPDDTQVWAGDDAAVLPGGRIAAVDTLVAGTHFDLRWASAADVGWKAVAVNLSDLAAMGAVEPEAALLSLVVPPEPPGLAAEVVGGVAEAATRYRCPVVGGDTTEGGELVVTVTVLGALRSSAPAVLRSGARVGDSVLVTGALGGAAAALRMLRAGDEVPAELAACLHRPEPRLEEGAAAAEAGATAMIDVSDGFALDAWRVAEASAVGLALREDALALRDGAGVDDARSGGDDYELLFTAPDPDRVAAAFSERGLAPPATVGRVVGETSTLGRADGSTVPLDPDGWEHRVP